MFNKKGISAIVATVLIILITVAAVTIIWAAIIPMVSNQLDEGNACLTATSQLSIGAAGYTCYDGTNLRVQIKQGAKDSGLEDVQILYSTAGATETAYAGAANVPGINEAKVVNFAVAAQPDSVSIAPIITIGSAKKVCDIAATLPSVPPCAP